MITKNSAMISAIQLRHLMSDLIDFVSTYNGFIQPKKDAQGWFVSIIKRPTTNIESEVGRLNAPYAFNHFGNKSCRTILEVLRQSCNPNLKSELDGQERNF